VQVARIITTAAAAAAATPLILALAACGDDGTGAGASTTVDASGDPEMVRCVAGEGAEADVEIAGFTFQPAELDVDAGATVTFTNQDATDHSVWSVQRVDGDPAWKSVGSDPEFRLPEVLHVGDASTCTFPAAGTYEYLCGVHNSMTGRIVVR
jgi:plastocyanin